MDKLRKLLVPFSWLYGAIVWWRNKFFDWGWLDSKAYDFPVICVGNLSVGGTGKSPMIEYLIRLLKAEYRLASLSRGYKRETTGFYLLSGKETAAQTGDEPLQFKRKFPNIQVAVDENRQEGIVRLRDLSSQPEVILLDDAFQHRKVRPSFSILLTAYDSIYPDDLLLPAGNLREPKSGAKRAKFIVVSKCPPTISIAERRRIAEKFELHQYQQLFFSTIAYAEALTNGEQTIPLNDLNKCCLVTGIAKPQPLVDYLTQEKVNFHHRRFPDHHNFAEEEIELLSKESFIVTTEKDFMRLKRRLPLEKLYYLPIKQKFITDGETFDRQIIEAIAAVFPNKMRFQKNK